MTTQTVTIPASQQHEGFFQKDITLNWVCPVCGGPRGEVKKVRSYDGSRWMVVDGWKNECGHIDYYGDVRREAKA